MSKQEILPVEPLIQCEAGRAKTIQRQSLYSPRTPKWPPSDKGELRKVQAGIFYKWNTPLVLEASQNKLKYLASCYICRLYPNTYRNDHAFEKDLINFDNTTNDDFIPYPANQVSSIPPRFYGSVYSIPCSHVYQPVHQGWKL